MKTGKLFVACSVVSLTLCAAPAFARPAKQKTLDVGVVLRLRDKFNDTVSAMYTGIETAKAIFERAHPGVKIVLHNYQHSEELDSVVAAVDHAISDGMPAVIGGELSEESFVLRDRLEPKKIVFITPTSSNPSVTEEHPFAFRSCFSDRYVARSLAEFTIDHLKPSAVGVVHVLSSPYTDFLSKAYLAAFKDREASVAHPIPIYEERILGEDKDYSDEVKHFIEKKVTHVFMPTHDHDLFRFVLEAAKQNYFPVLIGSDGWGSNSYVYNKLVEQSPYGGKFIAYRNSYWKEDTQSRMAKQFRAQYAKMHPRQPTAWSAVAFDAAWILFTAMEKASDPRNGDDIRKQMTALKEIPLVTAEHFSFGPDNSPRKELYIYRLDKTGSHYETALK